MASQFFQCPRCQNAVAVGSRFCSNCGQQFAQQPQQPTAQPQKKNNLLGLWIALGCIGLCVLCGGIGALNDKKKTDLPTNTAQVNTANQAVNIIPATPTPPPTFAELKAKVQPLLKMPDKAEYTADELKPFDDVMKPLREISKDAKEYKEAQNLFDQLNKKVSVLMAEILVMGPKPTNSAYDGNVAPAQDYLKQVLNDYSSSEYISWTPVRKVYIGKEPYWGTAVKLRAKNAFGAYIVKDIVFLIRNNHVVKAEGL